MLQNFPTQREKERGENIYKKKKVIEIDAKSF